MRNKYCLFKSTNTPSTSSRESIHRINSQPALSIKHLSYRLRITSEHAVFIINGLQDDVVLHLRELIYFHLFGEKQCVWHKEFVATNENDALNLAEYSLRVHVNNISAIEEIIWYFSKALGLFLPPVRDDLLSNMLVLPKDLNNKDSCVSETLDSMLARVMQKVLNRQKEHLNIRFKTIDDLKSHPEIPLELWSKEEIRLEQAYPLKQLKMEEPDNHPPIPDSTEEQSWYGLLSVANSQLQNAVGVAAQYINYGF